MLFWGKAGKAKQTHSLNENIVNNLPTEEGYSFNITKDDCEKDSFDSDLCKEMLIEYKDDEILNLYKNVTNHLKYKDFDKYEKTLSLISSELSLIYYVIRDKCWIIYRGYTHVLSYTIILF